MQPMGYFCTGHWISTATGHLFPILCALCIAGSMLFTTFLYLLILLKVRSVAANAAEFSRHALETEKAKSLSIEIRLAKRMFVIVVFFILDWSLYFCGPIMIGIIKGNPVPPVVDAASSSLAYTNSVLNPILYAVLDRRFSDTFWEHLRCQCAASTNDSEIKEQGEGTGRSRTSITVPSIPSNPPPSPSAHNPIVTAV